MISNEKPSNAAKLLTIERGYVEVYEPDAFEVKFTDLQSKAYALETFLIHTCITVQNLTIANP